jgi:TolB-like protein/DNA-binding winged helix-turn-helix (wHTH) protein
MERPTTTTLRIGSWRVNPVSGQISRNGETARLEARTMRLLLCLAEHAGAVVSIDDLLNQVWAGVAVSPDSVYQAVASLRRLLGDDPREPTYIATVPRLGYRMVATVGPWTDEPVRERAGAAGGEPAASSGRKRTWVAAELLCLVMAVGAAVAFMAHERTARVKHSAAGLPPQRSIAVLPFLDLTEGMHQETFADGMTEELIDKFSKIQGLRVASPTASFYFKGKQIAVAEIARTLGVAYVLDGSVRQSGTWVRVDVRLIRADNGYVVWSETYDQPMTNILMVQDDIAGAVTKALKASIGGKTDN